MTEGGRGPDRCSPGPVFVQPWWLDAVAPGRWDAITIERDGAVIARMPYVLERRRRLCLLTMPPLTQVLGPWLEASGGKYVTRLSRERQLLDELIDRLPSFDYFRQNFHHSVTNWLPFYWRGFEQTTRYTYRIEDLSDLDVAWSEMDGGIRNAIRKAERQIKTRDDLGLDVFMRLNELSFRHQGRELPYGQDLVERIDDACSARGRRRLLFAEDRRGHVHAAAYMIWDDESAYYLMGGADPDLRSSGAASLLLWEAIRFAATRTNAFDFEGSMHAGIERFFAGFGARQIPYFCVTKVGSTKLRIRRDVRGWLRSIRELR